MFDGQGQGAGVGDALVLSKGTTPRLLTNSTHNYSNANDVSVRLAICGTTRSIRSLGLEPIIDNLDAANRVFTFTSGAERITLSDIADACGVDIRIDSRLGELVDFALPTSSLSIITGSGNDTIQVLSVDSDYRASLTINGDDGTDSLLTTTALRLGDGATTGSLAVSVQTITLNDNISTDGGTIAGSVSLAGNLTIATNSVLIDSDSPLADGDVLITGTITINDGLTLTLRSGAGTMGLAAIQGIADGSASDATFDSAGALTVSGRVGTTDDMTSTDIGSVTIMNSDGTTFQSSVNAAAVTLEATNGMVAFQGDLTAATLRTAVLG